MNRELVKREEARLRMLCTAADLFHKQGVFATSPNEIIQASGTKKGQFYHYFKNKEGLIHQVLRYYLDAIRTGTSPINFEIASWQDLEGWFLTQIEIQKSFRMTRGCPFSIIANEVTENDELIRQDLNLIFEVVKNKLAAFFIKEKAKGRLAEHADEQRMADFCLAAAQGALLLGKIKRRSEPAEQAFYEVLVHLRRYAHAPPREKPDRPAYDVEVPPAVICRSDRVSTSAAKRDGIRPWIFCSAKGDETRHWIVCVAADLFHQQGIRRTSPDQIIEASETGKGQFYHYFKSKEGLVHEVLQYYLDAIRTGAYPPTVPINSWQDLETWFFVRLELQKSSGMTRGCPLGTIGNGLIESDELIRQDLSLIFEVVETQLAAFFIREKAKGKLSQDAHENRMATFCIATIQGALLLGKIKNDSQAAEAAVREALAHLTQSRTA